MTETIGFSFYTSSVETFFVDPDHKEVSPESEKTTYAVRTVFDPMGEVVELYKEMCNEGFLKRNNVVIIKDNVIFKNTGAIEARENLRIECKEIESTGSIEATSAQLTAGKVNLLGNCVLVRAKEILIRANEIFVDSARVEGHLTLEGCKHLEVQNLSDEAVRMWEEAAPEGCTFVASTACALQEGQEEAAEVEVEVSQEEATEVEVEVGQEEAAEAEVEVSQEEAAEAEVEVSQEESAEAAVEEKSEFEGACLAEESVAQEESDYTFAA